MRLFRPWRSWRVGGLLFILPLLLAADATPRRLDPTIPQPVYWFWWPETYLEDDYLDQARRLVDGGPFTHLVYSRRPATRRDAPDLLRALKAVADLGRPAGVGLVIQQWAWPLPQDRLIEAVSAHHWTLDSAGACQGTVPGHGRVLAAVLADQQKSGDSIGGLSAGSGHTPGMLSPDFWLDLTSAQPVPPQAVAVDPGSPRSRVRFSADASQAARLLVVLWAQPARPDVLDRDAAGRTTRDLSTRLGGVGAAGLVTDELRTLDSIGLPYYSPALEALYLDHFGRDLTADLLQGLAGSGGERIAARGRLLWARRQLAAAFEGIVARASREVCGAATFTGLHPTYFNFRPGDRHVAREFDRNAVSFWDLDRTYSQTDEEHPLPMRLGEARHCPGPVWFNMVYGTREVFERQIVEALPAGGRIHYHAAADRGEWGENVDTLDFLAMARRVEGRIRILNAAQRALPAADLLILWGYPGSVGWMPDRDPGAVTYEATFRLSESLWKRGFRCDVVPTYEIDDGDLSVGADGRIHYHDASYEAVLWTSPAYAEKATLALLEQYVGAGGRLFVAGMCGTDADGQDAGERFGALVNRSAAAWDHIPPADEAVETLMRLGVPRRRSDREGEMLDGLVITVDSDSLFRDADWRGEVSAAGTPVAFDARGVFAIKLDGEGRLEHLAAGGLQSASAAGRPLLALDGRADVALWRRVSRPVSSGRAHAGVPKTPAGQDRPGHTALLIRSDTGLVPPITHCDLPRIPAVEARTEVDDWPAPTVVVTVTNRGPAALDALQVTLRPLTQWRIAGGDRPPDRLAAGESARCSFRLTPLAAQPPAQGSRIVPIVLARAGEVDLQLEPEVYLAPAVEIEVPTQRRPVTLDAAKPAEYSITIRNPDRTAPRRGSVRLAVAAPGWHVEPGSRDVHLAAEKTWTGSFRLVPTSEAAVGQQGAVSRLVATFTPAEGGLVVTGRSAAFRIVDSRARATSGPAAPPAAPAGGRTGPGPARVVTALLLWAVLAALLCIFVWLRRARRGGKGAMGSLGLMVILISALLLAYAFVDAVRIVRHLVTYAIRDPGPPSDRPGAILGAMLGIAALLAGYAGLIRWCTRRRPPNEDSPRRHGARRDTRIGPAVQGLNAEPRRSSLRVSVPSVSPRFNPPSGIGSALALVGAAVAPAWLAGYAMVFRHAGVRHVFADLFILLLAVSWCAARLAAAWPAAPAGGGAPRRPSLVPRLALAALVVMGAVWLFHDQARLYLGYRLGYRDVGIHAEILSQTLRGRFLYWNGLPGNFLAMHFQPTWLVVLPFYALAPHVGTVFAAGALALAAGAVAVFMLVRSAAKQRSPADPEAPPGSAWAGLAAAAAYLAFPSISAQTYGGGYGIQPIVLAVPLMLFSFVCLLRRRTAGFVILTLLALMTHETVAVAYAGVGAFVIGLTLRRWWLAGAVTVGSAAYFLLAILWAPSAFGAPGFLRMGLFSQLGGSVGEILHTLLLRPAVVWPKVANMRALCFALALVSGLGFVPLLKARVLLAAAVPVLFIVLMDNPDWSSVMYWHQVPVLPVIVLAAVLGWRRAGERRGRVMRACLAGLDGGGAGRAAGTAMLVGALVAAHFFGRLPYSRLGASAPPRAADRLAEARNLRAIIPREASLTATDRLALFFTDQNHIYTIRYHKPDTDYVAIDLFDGRSEVADLRRAQRGLIAGGQYGLCHVGDQVMAYQRGAPAAALLDRVRRRALPPDAQIVDQDVGQGVLLHAVTIQPARSPGVFVVTLYWQATRRITWDLAFSCEFAPDEGAPAFPVRARFMGQGVYPTDLWQPGEVVCDRFVVPTPGRAAGRLVLTGLNILPHPAEPPLAPVP